MMLMSETQPSLCHFPAFLQLHQRPCLIVGGGDVAARKVRLLLEAGAQVSVMSPLLGEELRRLVDTGHIEWLCEEYCSQSLLDYWLIIAATQVAAVNQQVAHQAEIQGRWCNVVDDAEHSSFIVPAIVDRSPITVAVSSSGRSPVLARFIKSRIETLLSPRLGLLAEFAGRWRAQVKRVLIDAEQRRKFWEKLLSGPVADLVLSLKSERAERQMLRVLNRASSGEPLSERGRAFIVGAGPGDIELITVKGRSILETADVVMYDRLVSPKLLKISRRDAQHIYVGKQAGGQHTSQERINRMLAEQVRCGRRVCRLKGGDPFLFGRGGEEVAYLAQQGLPFEVVPGVTAAVGCAAYAGIPLTQRGISDKVMFLTAQGVAGEPTFDWKMLARPGQTLVFYMGVRRFRELASRLLESGMAPEQACAVVSRGTLKEQRVQRVNLVDLARLPIDPSLSPAVLIIGHVVDCAAANSWYGPDQLHITERDLAS